MLQNEVTVLLSAFNPTHHLIEQLETLRDQEGVSVVLKYRIDGPDETTPNLIAKILPEAELLTNHEHLGVPETYFELIRSVGPGAQYIALADQDDKWSPGKLRLALDSLSRVKGRPTLWCSDYSIIDSSGHEVRRRRHGMKPRFGNALVETATPGCTMVWNRAFQDLLMSGGLPKRVVMHDSFLLLVATGLGEVIYEPTPQIEYRVHSANAVGSNRKIIARLRRIVTSKSLGTPNLIDQTDSFLEHFGHGLPADFLQDALAIRRSRLLELIKVQWSGRIWRNGCIDNLFLAVWLMLMKQHSSAGASGELVASTWMGEANGEGS